MKFCMLTSFFGVHSFGGDAAYVDRLSRALARHGNEVHVIYCRDAFELVRGSYPDRDYQAPEGVFVHGLSSRFGALSPLWTQQTGRPGPKWPMIREIVQRVKPDVVHFHNLSLIGGPGLLLKDFGDATRLMTAHEHWLVCPMHVLWKNGESLCDEPSCHRCSVVGKRPPQLWRHGRLMRRGLDRLHRLIVPSTTAALEHRRRGIDRRIDVLPYFLPADWPMARRPELKPSAEGRRPYFACVGRLEAIKGFQDVIRLMDRFPGIDLRIAGRGEAESWLRDLAAGRPNVVFEGMLEGDALRRFVRGARAVAAPSLVPETFGYVVLEAFAQARPVIGRRLGALPEILAMTKGGRTFEDEESLIECLNDYADDAHLADRDGRRGWEAISQRYDEATHLRRYLSCARNEPEAPLKAKRRDGIDAFAAASAAA